MSVGKAEVERTVQLTTFSVKRAFECLLLAGRWEGGKQDPHIPVFVESRLQK